MTTPDHWDCDAYGPEGTTVGALCFLAPANQRICQTRAECTGRMIVARNRTFNRIHELATAGEPTMQYLAGQFTSPDQILGGPDTPPDDDD